MIKKAIAAVALFAVLGTVWAIDPGGHVSTVASYFNDNFKASPEYELRRLEERLKQQDEPLAASQEKLVRLDEDLDDRRKTAKDDEKARDETIDMLAQVQLKLDGEVPVSLGAEGRRDLEEERGQLVRHIEDLEAKITSNIAMLKARQQLRDAIYEKVAKMKEAKTRLGLKVEQLRAKLEEVRAKETLAEYHIDDSEFSQLNAMAKEIETEINVRNRLFNMRHGGKLQRSTKSRTDTIADQIKARKILTKYGKSGRDAEAKTDLVRRQ